jgi:hypothetical protein
MTNDIFALFEMEEVPRTPKLCVIGIASNALPEKQNKILDDQMFNSWKTGGSTDYDIADVLQRAGFKASPTAVNRHRNSKCVCTKGDTKHE